MATEGVGRTPRWDRRGYMRAGGREKNWEGSSCLAYQRKREVRGMSRKSHDVHPTSARLLGVEGTHRGRVLLIHLVHIRLV